MVARNYTDGPNIIKKRKQRNSDSDDDIRLDMSIEKARQASELAAISQTYAEDTASDIASKLSSSTQITNNFQNQSDFAGQVTQEISQLTTQVTDSTDIISNYTSSVASLGSVVAYWPLSTDLDDINAYRDVSGNSISLEISGVLDYTLSPSNTVYISRNEGVNPFIDTSAACSGLYSSNNVNYGLVNSTPSASTYFTMSDTDSFSIEFVAKLLALNSTYKGYFVDFGDQYAVFLDTDDKVYMRVGSATTTNAIDVSGFDVSQEWHHYAFSYNAIERSVSGYLDGELIFKDTNIGAPSSADLAQIRIFKSFTEAYINELKIYKIAISNSTVTNNYNSYKTRYLDFETGNTFVTGGAGGSLATLVDLSQGIVTGTNIGRSLISKTSVTNGLGTATTSIRVDGDGTEPEFGYTATANAYYKLLSTSFIKLPGEDYLTLVGQWTTNPDAYSESVEAYYHLSIIAGMSPPSPTEFLIETSGLYTYTTTNSGMFAIGTAITGLSDRSLYYISLRAKLKDDPGGLYTGELHNFNIVAMEGYTYSQVGPPAGQPPLPQYGYNNLA